MDNIVAGLHIIVDQIALIMGLILLVSIVQRHGQSEINRKRLMAAMFSITVILTMSDPIDLGAGGIHDLRNLLIGTSIALLGPMVGFATLASGIAMRLGIGGSGTVPGIVAMFGAFAGGLIWRYQFQNAPYRLWVKSAILGGLISIHLVGLLFFPMDLAIQLFYKMGPFYILGNIVGSLAISYLWGGEMTFLSEAEAAKIESHTDHLTGLLNRRGLEKALPELKAEFPDNKGRALLYFDIDNFKESNDTYGHAAGDEVLTLVADRILENLRRHDLFARLGGDEFAVVLPEVDMQEAQLIAERCRAIVDDECFGDGLNKQDITISLGAVWLHEPDSLDLMLQAADRALYQAKESGRNAVIFLSNFYENQPTSTGQSPALPA